MLQYGAQRYVVVMFAWWNVMLFDFLWWTNLPHGVHYCNRMSVLSSHVIYNFKWYRVLSSIPWDVLPHCGGWACAQRYLNSVMSYCGMWFQNIMWCHFKWKYPVFVSSLVVFVLPNGMTSCKGNIISCVYKEYDDVMSYMRFVFKVCDAIHELAYKYVSVLSNTINLFHMIQSSHIVII
jgi:hypothetical protein